MGQCLNGWACPVDANTYIVECLRVHDTVIRVLVFSEDMIPKMICR